MKSIQISNFRFKEFSVEHSRSSMKVGVDGVLIGAWGSVEGHVGMDIGCGCGLISLMAAQRNKDCVVEAIDIHGPSVEEAESNFKASSMAERLSARRMDAKELPDDESLHGKFDFILSNPPFFNSGISNPATPREQARHIGSISPAIIVRIADKLLRPGGTLSMILPVEEGERLMSAATIPVERICYVADKCSKPFKRIMIQMRKGRTLGIKSERLFIRNADGEYTNEYRSLTAPFYLAF